MRPEPYDGMLVYRTRCQSWYKLEHYYDLYSDTIIHDAMLTYLLPGEPGCPWPPPPEFQHEWKEGDRAWALDEGTWYNCRWETDGFITNSLVLARNDTPALYIPETKHDVETETGERTGPCI